MAKPTVLTETDEALIRAMQGGVLAVKREVMGAKNAGQSLVGYFNGIGDVDGVQNACSAMEALTDLELAYRRCHNALSDVLVAQYGKEQAAKIIISNEKGGGGGRG